MERRAITHGIVPVLATPFSLDGAVDYQSLDTEIGFQATAGCEAVAIFGFASEFYKLGENERESILERAVARCHSVSMSLVASVSDQSTEQAVKTARKYQSMGATGLMLLPPYSVPSSSAGIQRHISRVAGSVSLPILLQYAPKDTNLNLGLDDIEAICGSNENIVGIKLDGPNLGRLVSEITGRLSGRIDVLIGYAGVQMIEALSRGATGIMPGASLTDIYTALFRDYSTGRSEQAAVDHERLLPFLSRIFTSIESIIKWEKKILMMRGLIGSDYCRHPGFEPDEYELEAFKQGYRRIADYFAQRGVFIGERQG